MSEFKEINDYVSNFPEKRNPEENEEIKTMFRSVYLLLSIIGGMSLLFLVIVPAFSSWEIQHQNNSFTPKTISSLSSFSEVSKKLTQNGEIDGSYMIDTKTGYVNDFCIYTTPNYLIAQNIDYRPYCSKNIDPLLTKYSLQKSGKWTVKYPESAPVQ